MCILLIKESKLIRNIYRKRINGMTNTFGMFTANIQLKKDSIPYINRNQYIYNTNDIWSFNEGKEKVEAVLVSYQIPEMESAYTHNIDLLTPMTWKEVELWENTKVMRRGEKYEKLKQEKASQCIELAAKNIDGLWESVENIYTSTPLTYRDYTATCEGSAYGLQKDYSNLMTTMLTPRTPIPNLLLTGQNLNLHGILGVSMTAFLTCSELLGHNIILNELKID
jgi:all-trans-retinol 13,14-reductase